jgi:phage antirepressor YoqD-like protein
MNKLTKNVNELQNQEVMTTKQLADFLNTSPKVVLENAKKCLPNKIIENGKATYWNRAEVTILIEQLKSSNPNQHTFTGAVKALGTELTPALKIKQAMEMMQEAYEEELQIIRARAELAETALNRIADGKGCYTVNQAAKALKLPYGNKTLFQNLRTLQVLNQDNSPKQEQINSGHFKVIVKHINDEIGSKPVTLVTGKGLVYLAKKFNAEIDESIQPDA